MTSILWWMRRKLHVFGAQKLADGGWRWSGWGGAALQNVVFALLPGRFARGQRHSAWKGRKLQGWRNSGMLNIF
ncbi:MAG TPA: hypothetical protein VE028_07020 [Nitratidesulfovibrio sp.]|nr:hypothetical protein [Nitratidesulfovibrio sp.]